ncbi:MAG TPA: AgmX/PglI C-terminal domain-containing protein [Polyangiaceae bacterium]|nr:AgmX/PglI C-terminal domain-containing protein [Polyangiaceae bacterium]
MGPSPRSVVRRALIELSRAALPLLGAALLAGACGSPETQEPKVPDEAAKPVEKPVDPSEPRLTMKGESVLVDGSPSGSASEAVKEGRPVKIEVLFHILEERRKAWVNANPGKEFPGRCRLDLDAQTPDAVWRSVLMTAFFAGCNRIALESGGGQVPIRASIPLPPERGGPQRPLQIAVRTDSFDALWLSPKDAGKQKVAPRRPMDSSGGPVDLPELSEVLKKECASAGEPCFDVISLRSTAPLAFGELLGVVRAIQPVWKLPEAAPLFDFMRGTSLTGLPEGHSGRIPGTGRIEPNEVRKVVRANFDKFTACYQEGLKRDPKLAGRVAVQFVIEPDGTVSEASSVAAPPSKAGAGAQELVTTLNDKKVVGCVLDAYRKLVFPKPQGGRVPVVYPIELGSK